MDLKNIINFDGNLSTTDKIFYGTSAVITGLAVYGALKTHDTKKRLIAVREKLEGAVEKLNHLNDGDIKL